MKVNINKLCRMVAQLPPLGELEILLDNWEIGSPLIISHRVWQECPYLLIGGKKRQMIMLNILSDKRTSFADQIKKKLTSYLGEIQSNIEVVRKPIADVAFTLQGDIDGIVRNELIKLILKAKGSLKIPEHNAGNFSLAMLDQDYDIFYFESVSSNDGLLTFYGTTDISNKSLYISEHDLPDRGLLYIYDYLTTGAY